MKRLSFVLLVVLLVISSGVLSACTASPKARTDEFVKYLPGETASWERDDDATVQLVSSTVSSKGHVTLFYTGPDDATAYIVVETHGGVDAAEVALSDRMRDLLLRGLVFDKNRAPQKATADVAQQGPVRYALLQEEEIVVEINVLAADDEHLVTDEVFDELLAIVRGAYEKVLDD
ncbi:MAG: hypothetical protein HY866_00565 [Chloroflexi bacterium]|nr:hypothetical protein [Chloroflexota bacterium]